ncbi:hypothetical protein C8R44DRAFT_727150 [Mycena epipterygia]|nr:hypothetical protein C8R44DRAFT_727150 [Mycena epipterygia]
MFAKTLALFIAMPLLVHAVSISSRGTCNRHYTVKEGDICDSISAANNVSTYQLKTINAGYIDTGCGNLVPGASICLGYAGEDCSTTYVVAADDTCEAITESHAGVSSAVLYANNPQINAACDNIYIGQVLCVASSVQVPPVAGAPPAATTADSTTAEAAPTAAPQDEEDEDDSDLPFCDEL